MSIYIVGLTGGMGCGKSTVAKCLNKLSIPISDADSIARDVMKSDEVIEKLKTIFGKSIFDEKGKIKKEKLARIIFSNEEKRKKLNETVHPKVWESMIQEAKEYEKKGNKIIFFEVPLLLECGWNKLVDEIWVVKTEFNLRIKRLKLRTGLTEEHLKKRIECQMSENEKEKYANVVINNSYSFEKTDKQVTKEIKKLFSRLEKR